MHTDTNSIINPTFEANVGDKITAKMLGKNCYDLFRFIDSTVTKVSAESSQRAAKVVTVNSAEFMDVNSYHIKLRKANRFINGSLIKKIEGVRGSNR